MKERREKINSFCLCVCVSCTLTSITLLLFIWKIIFSEGKKKRSTRWKRKENKTWRELLKDKMGEREEVAPVNNKQRHTTCTMTRPPFISVAPLYSLSLSLLPTCTATTRSLLLQQCLGTVRMLVALMNDEQTHTQEPKEEEEEEEPFVFVCVGDVFSKASHGLLESVSKHKREKRKNLYKSKPRFFLFLILFLALTKKLMSYRPP